VNLGRRPYGSNSCQGEGHDMPGVGVDIDDAWRVLLHIVNHLRPVPQNHRIDALADDPHLTKPHLLLCDLRAEELANKFLGSLL
jgi:hypothetical protein